MHLGSLTCSGNGQMVAVSCFSDGVRRYDGTGKPQPVLPTPEPCRFAAMTYSGKSILTAGVFGGVRGLDMDARILFEHRADQAVVGLGLMPLGERAVMALADGRVIGLDLGAAPGIMPS